MEALIWQQYVKRYCSESMQIKTVLGCYENNDVVNAGFI